MLVHLYCLVLQLIFCSNEFGLGSSGCEDKLLLSPSGFIPPIFFLLGLMLFEIISE